MKAKIRELVKDQVSVVVGTIKKTLKHKDNGEPWINLKLTDNSGSCFAKFWQENPLYQAIELLEDMTQIEATVLCVQTGNFINVEVQSFQVLEKKEVKPIDPNALKNELRSAIAGIKDEHLGKLLRAIFGRKDVNEAFFTAPATMMSGYSFEGGNLAFTVRSIRLVKVIANVFNAWEHNVDHFSTKLNEDLLTAACMLDGIGRVKSLRFNGSRIEKSMEGELFGESYLAMKVLLEEIEKIEFPNEQRLMLEHMIGSSKSRTDWGALFTPRSREAIAFSIILNLNLQMGHFEHLDRHADVTDQFAMLFDKRLYLGKYDE